MNGLSNGMSEIVLAFTSLALTPRWKGYGTPCICKLGEMGIVVRSVTDVSIE